MRRQLEWNAWRYDYYNSLKTIIDENSDEIRLIDQMADYLNKTGLSLDTKVKIGVH